MNYYLSRPRTSLGQRAMELRMLRIPGARIRFFGGHELRFNYIMKPSIFGRQYHCMLRFRLRAYPDAYVIGPDLKHLAGGRALPHTYSSDLTATKLCLWLPGSGEFTPRMRMIETFIPWTAHWLDYYEDWLFCSEWRGGGVHPQRTMH